MKKFNKKIIAIFIASLVFAITGSVAVFAAGPATVNLLSSGNFVVLSKTGITNIPTSTITGNVGASPITGASIGLTCGEVTGIIYSVDATGPLPCRNTNAVLLGTAIFDMEAAYTDAAGRALPDATELYAGNIGGRTFAPGLYKWSTNVTIPSNVTLSGSATDIWIFQIAGDLNVASKGSIPSGVKVILTGGAKASNVFWQVGGPTGVTVGTYATFNGSILSAKQIILQTGAVLNGRALAQTGITLDHNTISAADVSSATLNVVKHVVGGSLASSSFNLYVKTGGVNVLFSPEVGAEAPGTSYSLASGAYVVSEDNNASYTKSFSGDCDPSGSIALVAGSSYLCTITNTYISHTSGGGGIVYGCKDPTAKNYDYFVASNPALCVYTLNPSNTSNSSNYSNSSSVSGASNVKAVPVTTITPTLTIIPKLPNTGFPPKSNNWFTVLFSDIIKLVK